MRGSMGTLDEAQSATCHKQRQQRSLMPQKLVSAFASPNDTPAASERRCLHSQGLPCNDGSFGLTFTEVYSHICNQTLAHGVAVQGLSAEHVCVFFLQLLLWAWTCSASQMWQQSLMWRWMSHRSAQSAWPKRPA